MKVVKAWLEQLENWIWILFGRVTKAVSDAAILLAILEHKVQLIGAPTQVDANTLALDSALFTLLPGEVVFPGSPTVKVTGSMTVTATAGSNVLFELVRDRDGLLGTATVITHQQVAADAAGLATATLVALDAAASLPAQADPLENGETHIWSIRASVGTGVSPVGADPALILLEQEPAGVSVTIPTPPTSAVPLGTAGNFAGFAGSGITTTGGSTIDGDIGVSPAVTSAAITGFALVLDASGQFSTSTQVHPGTPAAPYPAQPGHVFAFDYAAPTPAKVNTATLDMIAAYNNAAGRPATVTSAGADIGGTTLEANSVYRYTGATSVTAGPLTLHGTGATDVIILQVAGTLDIHQNIVLTGTLAGHPERVFFAVAGQITMFPGLTVNGEFLGQTGIAMQAATVLNGRALAQTALTLINNTIVEV